MKTAEELTERQKKFAEFYFVLNNGTKAAIKAGYAESGAHVEASRAIKNPKVKAYIEELQKERRERIQSRLAGMSEKAAEMMFELATTADSESVRLTTIKDILNRAGYKAVEKLENKNEHSGKITFGFRDPSLKEE
ncbi:terminase small subunit [Neobacillus niacini]|uniref:terminase small subunit n=1 Tax=Neobacillus niacini TaxID=86668 RepID=UPI0006935477|nr:terminase small subunit [Neobacillus niacini]